MATFATGDPVLNLHGLDDIDDISGPWEDSIIKDQDDAEAVLQPAISATASHFASQRTPATEKAAVLGISRGADFDISSGDNSDASPDLDDPDGNTPRSQDTEGFKIPRKPIPERSSEPSELGLPAPWQAGPKQLVIDDPAPRPSKSYLGTTFKETRNRSKSTGQEALKRLSKAFPSLSAPSHFFPSLPTSFFSSSSEKVNSHSPPWNPFATSETTRSSRASWGPNSVTVPVRPGLNPNQARVGGPSNTPLSRPPYLRRVTSDDSLLYHTLSRTSSFGNESQFDDVRQMVNIRLMALKDSLPELPNLRMPSLPKMYNQARASTYSLNAIHPAERTASPSNLGSEAGASSKEYPTVLDRVLDELTGDIVVLGGYRGSILRSAEGSRQQLWAPVKIGLNMRKANLEVGLEDEDEERMEETIIPSGMLTHIGPIDVSRRLLKKLRTCENARTGKLRVWEYGYDWRLSPPLSSRKLIEFLERLPSNKRGMPHGALVIAHSLGGLITRHAVNQRPELFSGVLYAGAPQRCINILGPMRNGDVILFNEKLLTAQVNFSMRTSFVFLPEDGFCFVDKNTGEEYPVNFYDPQEWIKWHLSPCIQPALPPFNRQPSSSLSSFLPNSLRARSDSKSEKQPPSPPIPKDRTIAPQMNSGTHQQEDPSISIPGRERNLAYLTRTLAMTRKFRSELAHNPVHQDANAYPPFAIMYGKGIPTVYAVQVNGRESIPCADVYDDILFRGGDGVVLAKEAMLPEGYSLVRGGRICTERGHMTMLGDMPAVGRALEALLRGRKKGIGIRGYEKW